MAKKSKSFPVIEDKKISSIRVVSKGPKTANYTPKPTTNNSKKTSVKPVKTKVEKKPKAKNLLTELYRHTKLYSVVFRTISTTSKLPTYVKFAINVVESNNKKDYIYYLVDANEVVNTSNLPESNLISSVFKYADGNILFTLKDNTTVLAELLISKKYVDSVASLLKDSGCKRSTPCQKQ